MQFLLLIKQYFLFVHKIYSLLYSKKHVFLNLCLFCYQILFSIEASTTTSKTFGFKYRKKQIIFYLVSRLNTFCRFPKNIFCSSKIRHLFGACSKRFWKKQKKKRTKKSTCLLMIVLQCVCVTGTAFAVFCWLVWWQNQKTIKGKGQIAATNRFFSSSSADWSLAHLHQTRRAYLICQAVCVRARFQSKNCFRSDLSPFPFHMSLRLHLWWMTVVVGIVSGRCFTLGKWQPEFKLELILD